MTSSSSVLHGHSLSHYWESVDKQTDIQSRTHGVKSHWRNRWANSSWWLLKQEHVCVHSETDALKAEQEKCFTHPGKPVIHFEHKDIHCCETENPVRVHSNQTTHRHCIDNFMIELWLKMDLRTEGATCHVSCWPTVRSLVLSRNLCHSLLFKGSGTIWKGNV